MIWEKLKEYLYPRLCSSRRLAFLSHALEGQLSTKALRRELAASAKKWCHVSGGLFAFLGILIIQPVCKLVNYNSLPKGKRVLRKVRRAPRFLRMDTSKFGEKFSKKLDKHLDFSFPQNTEKDDLKNRREDLHFLRYSPRTFDWSFSKYRMNTSTYPFLNIERKMTSKNEESSLVF